MSNPKPKLYSTVRSFIWVPSLFLAMGIPFNVINGTSATMFKSFGLSDGQITVALGNIVIAWSLKPFWAAFLDMYRTKKFFVLLTEFICAVLFGAVAFCLPQANYFEITIALLWIAAFASSTQDICGDGIYLTSLSKSAQGTLAGVQGMAWNLGRFVATATLVNVMAGVAKDHGWSNREMWIAIWLTAAALMLLFMIYHYFFLPTGSVEHRPANARQVFDDFRASAATFFHKRAFWGMIAFVFLYRLGEGLLITEGKLFVQSTVESGGLGMTVAQVSSIDGQWGTLGFIGGSIAGGFLIGAMRLSRCLWFLGLCLNIPHFTYIYLSHRAAAGHGIDYNSIATLVTIEKFGYGFGFVGNMVYMMQQIAPGRSTMTHYAFATALMNFMLVPTTMISGPLADWLGFKTFFFVAMFASIPSVLAAWRAPFPLKESETADGTTVDDPTRLGAGERPVQLIAGRASMFAMANILTLLIVDAKILGSLQGAARGTGQVQFALLVASALVKGYFSLRAFQLAGDADTAAAASGEKIYQGNARGARIATVVCGATTVGILAFAARMAF
jgi:PAT family beta-lactamase induction signal transducer AmpG